MPPALKKYKCGEPGCEYSAVTSRHLNIHLSKSGHTAGDVPPRLNDELPYPEHGQPGMSVEDAASEESDASGKSAPAAEVPDPDSMGALSGEISCEPQAAHNQPTAQGSQPTGSADKRSINLHPVPGCAVSPTDPEETDGDDEESAAFEFAEPLPSLELTAEEFTVAEIMQKLSEVYQDKLLKLPSLRESVRWRNSKAFKDHVDGHQPQVCLCCLLTQLDIFSYRAQQKQSCVATSVA